MRCAIGHLFGKRIHVPLASCACRYALQKEQVVGGQAAVRFARDTRNDSLQVAIKCASVLAACMACSTRLLDIAERGRHLLNHT